MKQLEKDIRKETLKDIRLEKEDNEFVVYCNDKRIMSGNYFFVEGFITGISYCCDKECILYD